MKNMEIYRLDNPIRPYPWGSRTALAEFLGQKSPAPEPQAELWMGAYPKSPSRIFREGKWIPLPDLIEEDAEALLGAAVVERYGPSFPFLFKVLAVERSLSIQAHPDSVRALEGFEREERAGIPRDAMHRNYRDPFHKPEILCALTPFHMLRGFRPAKEIREGLRRFGAETLLGGGEGDLRTLAMSFLEADEETVRRVLHAVLERARKIGTESSVESRWYRIGHWIQRLASQFPNDRGALAPLYLHLVELSPGQAMFTGPGVLHGYLEGVGVELMVSSDNVLRGGLTGKHVDVGELLANLDFEPSGDLPLEPIPAMAGEECFPVPTPQLSLSRLTLTPGAPWHSAESRAVEILLCTEGEGEVLGGEGDPVLTFRRGESFLVPAILGAYGLRGVATLFRAGVGDPS